MNKMKFVILIVLISLTLAFNAWSQSNTDTTSVKQVNIVSLPNGIEALSNNNNATIDSLVSANNALKVLLRDSQKETESKDREISKLQHKIDDLQNITIKHLEESNDTLQRRLISMASNFLYIPYDEYSIQEIAIPAFLSTKGTTAYIRYQNRLPLLQNYKSDIESLINSLSHMEKDFGVSLTLYRNNKASEHLNNLQASPLYKRYTSYDDWENTYLGEQIRIVYTILKSPSEDTLTLLKNIRTNLEGLLNYDK